MTTVVGEKSRFIMKYVVFVLGLCLFVAGCRADSDDGSSDSSDSNEESPVPADPQTSVCECQLILDPVCGTDGKQYDNECMLTCAGQTLDPSGACLSPPSGNFLPGKK